MEIFKKGITKIIRKQNNNKKWIRFIKTSFLIRKTQEFQTILKPHPLSKLP